MKIALCLLFIGTALAFEKPVSYEETLLRNSIDELVRQTLEYARWLQKRHEPYPFPPLPEMTLVDDDVNVKFSTSDIQLSKAGDFTIDKVSNNLPKLTSSFGVTLPTIHLEGKFQVTGTVLEKEVSGSGSFVVDITNLVPTGDIQFGIVDHSLQIKDLKINYELSGVKFNVQGLNVEGMSQEQIEDFLDKQLVEDLQTKKQFFCEKIANHVTEVANKLLKGHSLQDVLNFLKELVAATPDPPPFPTILPIIA